MAIALISAIATRSIPAPDACRAFRWRCLFATAPPVRQTVHSAGRVGTTAREWKTFCGNNWPSLKSSGSFATFAARYRASSHVNYQSPIVLTDELGRRQGSRAMRRGHLAAAVTKLPDRWRKSCRANGTQGATSKILPLYDYGAQRRRGVADRLIQHLNGRKASVTIPVLQSLGQLR